MTVFRQFIEISLFFLSFFQQNLHCSLTFALTGAIDDNLNDVPLKNLLKQKLVPLVLNPSNWHPPSANNLCM
jgi:hypothetical protein